VRQKLLAEQGIAVSLRTVERAVAPLRRELAAEARATVRFETPLGKQMQVDFGEKRIVIGGETIRVYLFVATLGHSRRLHVRASGTSARPAGSRGWRAHSGRSAGCRRRFCSTTPGRWWCTTMA
jgi:transposase